MPISLYRVYGPGFATFKATISTHFIYIPFYSIFPLLSQYKHDKRLFPVLKSFLRYVHIRRFISSLYDTLRTIFLSHHFKTHIILCQREIKNLSTKIIN